MTSLVAWETPILSADPSSVDHVRAQHEALRRAGEQAMPDNEVTRVLFSVLPPREWAARDGRQWKQFVSHEQATRDEVSLLQTALDTLLARQQARPDGLCPVREDLMAQAMDEMIRQVTILSPERGVMLMRLRDEARMTLAVYETMYLGSTAIGVKTLVETESGMVDREDDVAAAEMECEKCRAQVSELETRLSTLTSDAAVALSVREAARAAEVEGYARRNEQLRLFIQKATA